MGQNARAILVFLIYDRGEIEVTRQKPPEVTLDLQHGTWQVKEPPFSAFSSDRLYKIGQDSRIAVHRYQRDGIIGVYDPTKIEHMRSMKHAILMAAREEPSFFETEYH